MLLIAQINYKGASYCDKDFIGLARRSRRDFYAEESKGRETTMTEGYAADGRGVRSNLNEARHLISQLAHVEITSPRPEESVGWFKDVLGLQESGRDGRSVYLRAWGEFFHHSLVVTEGEEPALVHVGWRAGGPEELEQAASRLEASGSGEGWQEATVGHGPAYRFRAPGGQLHEVFWEVERYQAPPELVTDFPGRPQKYPRHGVCPRYIDHVTVATPDVIAEGRWHEEHLGLKFTDYIAVPAGDSEFVVFGTCTSESTHELGIVPEASGARGRVNHIAFWLEQRSDVERAAQVFMGADTPIEFGPGIHGIDEITYLYVREPGGIRVELNSGGRRRFEPDWETRRWGPDVGGMSIYRNLGMPESMMESFPVPGKEGDLSNTGLFSEP